MEGIHYGSDFCKALIGCGHCAQALAPLLNTVGFRVTVFDERADYANRENFPTAEHVLVGNYTKLSDHIRFTGEMIYRRALRREAIGITVHGCPMH